MSGMLSRTLTVPAPQCDAHRASGVGIVDRPQMRIVQVGRRPIVEMVTSVAQNRLYEAYRALRAHGVQVIHTAVRRSGDTLVQLLHLAEADGSELSTRRLRETLATLRRECGVTLMRSSRRSVQAWIEPAAAALCF